MSRDAVLCLKQLHLTLFYKISESSYVPPHQYARKTQSNAVSRYQPRFHAECSTVFRKTPLNSKPIPQFDNTNYLALISRTCSTRIRCQTFSNSWVEQNLNFRVLDARLNTGFNRWSSENKCITCLLTLSRRIKAFSLLITTISKFSNLIGHQLA